MAAHTSDHNFNFQLPSLTYVDAKWEEPNLRAAPQARDTAAYTGFFARMIAQFQAWRRDRQSMAEFASMSDYELSDIGLSRADMHRVFDPALNQDLQARGNYV